MRRKEATQATTLFVLIKNIIKTFCVVQLSGKFEETIYLCFQI